MKTALVTGASRGIGAAIASRLRELGFETICPTRALLDLDSVDSIEAYCSSLEGRPVDVLVNNAGINILTPLSEISLGTWDQMIAVNLRAPTILTGRIAPRMARRGWGRILNVSTIFSLVTKENRGLYSITKAGLNSLTRSAAIEYGPSGVLVNSIAPGYVDTDLTRQNNSAEEIRRIEETIPVKRMAKAVELARIAGFLVSEDNTYITGQNIVADGGFTCRLQT